jgi:methylated-DNA-[protein]-cysteine S-methyltransferase
MVGGMRGATTRVARTEYAVPGWGSGELWIADGVVLAHEFAFDTDAGVGARPPKGAHAPPTSTVPGERARVGHDFVPGMRPASPGLQLVEHGTEQGADLDVDAVVEHGTEAGADLAEHGAEPGADLDADSLVERFHAFFAGEDPGLGDVPVDLSWTTPFQHAVALTLRGIPRGEVVSYGELAALAGYPGAARAAGTFCARNRLMLLVPCHRVLGATGLGGYGSAGIGVKRRLLALEGVHL